ncbi:hypothetical protein AAU61_04685 [Desulfocarbo indianensis]|nr:hypothetical protein AAU61_04685 [Desulfocarbo indianensis]
MDLRFYKALPLLLLIMLAWPAPAAWAYGQPLSPDAGERKALQSLKQRVSGEIVFASRRRDNWRLFRMDADGSNLVMLSRGQANNRWPFFVMGGRKLIYHSDQAGPMQIYLAEPDLSGSRLLSPEGQAELFHGITADGSLMMVAKDESPQGYWLRHLDSGREVRVDFSAHGLKQGWLGADLSPDGRKLAYLFKANGPGGQPGRAVYIMDLDPETGRASNPREVSDGCFTVWRDDSKALLTCRFALFRGAPGTTIWLAGPQGPQRKVAAKFGWNYFPAFSPDGNWLAWAASPLTQKDDHTGNYEVYLQPLDGGEAVRLTFHSAPDVSPTWRAQRELPFANQGLTYQAEDYAHPPGKVVADIEAAGDKAVRAERNGPGGHVVFGQYENLPAGRYRALFRVKIGEAGGDGLVAELDAVDKLGSRSLAKRQVRAKELTAGRYQEVELDFNSDEPLEGLELRVAFHPGAADLQVDQIVLQRLERGRLSRGAHGENKG